MDEYESYSPDIVRMLDAGIDIERLTDYMVLIIEENMGVPCDRKRTQEIAAELVEF